MLPTLSHLSVNVPPVGRLRLRCSSRYLRISLLHLEFRQPLGHSRYAVSTAVPRLSPGISQSTYISAYARFTPSHSEQRLHLPYYRGCWHGISQCFFCQYRQMSALFTQTPFFLTERDLQPKGLLHSRGVAASGLRPLCKIPHCCLP